MVGGCVAAVEKEASKSPLESQPQPITTSASQFTTASIADGRPDDHQSLMPQEMNSQSREPTLRSGHLAIETSLDVNADMICFDEQWLVSPQLAFTDLSTWHLDSNVSLHDLENPIGAISKPSGAIPSHDPLLDFSLSTPVLEATAIWDHEQEVNISSSESQASPYDLNIVFDQVETQPEGTAATPITDPALSKRASPVTPMTPTGLNLPPNHHEQLQKSPGTQVSCANLTSSSSPGLKVPVGDRLYLAHSKVNLMDVLPLQLDSLFSLTLTSSPVRYAAMALAAANLTNLQGKRSSNGNGPWSMKAAHAENARTFMSKTVEPTANDAETSIISRLVVQVLTVCYQLEIGCVSDIGNALSILDGAILSCSDQILTLSGGVEIARSWLYLRSMFALIEAPQALYGSECQIESLKSQFEKSIATSHQIIDLASTKAFRIWHRILLLKCMQNRGDTPKETMKKSQNWWAILKGGHENCLPSACLDVEAVHILDEEELYRELAGLKLRLDDCEVPEEFPALVDEAGPLPSSVEDVKPLHFSSHKRAMACADYAFAQLICDGNLLRELLSPSEDSPQQTSPWLHLLFRIAMGLDPIECTKRNMYCKDITTYLYTAIIFAGGKNGFDLFSSFLEHLLRAGLVYERPLVPLHSYASFFEALRREASKGRTIFIACLTYDAWASKEALYSDGAGEYVIIYGRDLEGRYFNDMVPLHEC